MSAPFAELDACLRRALRPAAAPVAIRFVARGEACPVPDLTGPLALPGAELAAIVETLEAAAALDGAMARYAATDAKRFA